MEPKKEADESPIVQPAFFSASDCSDCSYCEGYEESPEQSGQGQAACGKIMFFH